MNKFADRALTGFVNHHKDNKKIESQKLLMGMFGNICMLETELPNFPMMPYLPKDWGKVLSKDKLHAFVRCDRNNLLDKGYRAKLQLYIDVLSNEMRSV